MENSNIITKRENKDAVINVNILFPFFFLLDIRRFSNDLFIDENISKQYISVKV